MTLLAIFMSVLAIHAGQEARWSKATGAPTHCATKTEQRAMQRRLGARQLLAWTTIYSNRTEVGVSPYICGLLRGNFWFDNFYGVFVLSHERAHVHGVEDEEKADCYAGRHFVDTAAKAGFHFTITQLKMYFRNDPCAPRILRKRHA